MTQTLVKPVIEYRGTQVSGAIDKVLPISLVDLPLSRLIADGRYQHRSSIISADRFVLERGEGPLTVYLAKFEDFVLLEHTEAWFSANGFEPATMRVLLTMGCQHPDEQVRTPVVASGSSWTTRGSPRHVPLLGNRENVQWDHGRYLKLMPATGWWGTNNRFVAVPKTSAFI